MLNCLCKTALRSSHDTGPTIRHQRGGAADGFMPDAFQKPPGGQRSDQLRLRTNPYSTVRRLRELGIAAGLPKHRTEQLLIDGVQQGWVEIRSGSHGSKPNAM